MSVRELGDAVQEQVNQPDRAKSEPLAGSRSAPRILVVDDDVDECEVLRRTLELHGYSTTTETSPLSALERVKNQDFDLVLTDFSMSGMDGLTLCKHVREKRPGLPVILLTGRGSMSTAVAALRLGATDFLTKPLDASELSASVARALGRSATSPSSSAPPALEAASGAATELRGAAAVSGQSPPMRRLNALITDLSQSVTSVIIQGETGTGKEVVARAIHASSRYAKGPFVAVSCAAIPAGLLESELFGHVRGAFTDARTAKLGLLPQANGGTLLLDEIGELPLAMQPKLLRALQERRVRPVGGQEEIPFDCRVIAATNRDLEVEVAQKRFREDLYYRLDVMHIRVPPLRERGDDILLLARHFLERFVRKDRAPLTLGAAAAEKLLAYAWPGNVRELENCIERAVTFCRGDVLGVEDLPEKIQLGPSPREAHRAPAAAPTLESSELEHDRILQALERFGGNKTQAAELLGIDRSTLYRRLAARRPDGGR